MKYFNFKIQIQLILFSLIFILSRVDNIIFFNSTNLYIDANYKHAINDFFWEYLYFQHISPIGKIFYDKIIYSISNLIGLEISTIFYFLNILVSYFFYFFIILYINKVYKNNNNIKMLLVLLAVSLSIFFDNYELWRPNYHDHLTFSLVAFFSLLLVFKKDFANNFVIYSLLFFLLISYTLGFTFFLITIFFIFIFQLKNKAPIRSSIIVLILVSSFFVLLSFKNFYNVGVFSPTSNGGANLIQRTIHSIGNDNYYNLINKSEKLPDWFKVCNNYIYDNYKKIQSKNNDNFQSKLAHGLCFLKENNKFDFIKYKQAIINKTSNLDFIDKIEKDISNLRNRKWIFSGTHSELSFSSSVAYTSYGSQIFFNALKNYPKQMVVGNIGKKGIVLTLLQMTSYGGLFPDYYENFSYPNRNKILSFFYKILILLIVIIGLLTPYIVFKKIKKILNVKRFDYKDIIYLMFVSIVIMQIFLISTITCCENPRITVIYFPIIFIILLLNIEDIIKRKK